MSTLRKRLKSVETHRAFESFVAAQRLVGGRSEDELRFFAIHGYFPEAAGQNVPEQQDFRVGGIRTILRAERT